VSLSHRDAQPGFLEEPGTFARSGAALSHFMIITNARAFTKLFARTNLPSRVTEVLRTILPPPGIGQLWNFAVFGSKRTIMFGVACQIEFRLIHLIWFSGHSSMRASDRSIHWNVSGEPRESYSFRVFTAQLGRKKHAEDFRCSAACNRHVCWLRTGKGAYAQAHDPGLHRGPAGRCDMRLRDRS
jgi:hypothetical protein